MHRVTGRWKLGLALALITAMCWGVLPLALKIVLEGMDAYTVTWYRFAVATVVLTILLAVTGQLPSPRGLSKQVWVLLAVALAGLIGNYVLYLMSLHFTSPAVAQTVIQLGPLFFLLGGLLIFRERFTLLQWLGLAALLAGLGFFFNRRLPELLDLSHGTGLGVALIVLAALTWASYALAQKQLLKRLGSQQILLLIYIGGTLALLPPAQFSAVLHLNALQAWLLAFACVNTLIAYGAFAEALEHWEVSRVSAVLAITPLITLTAVWLVEHFVPGLLPPERLNALSIFGAALVVAGSAVCVLAGSRRGAVQPAKDPVTP